MDTSNFTAFVSYSHDDDAYEDGGIGKLAERLEKALRVFTGRRDMAVFYDRADIAWGDAWRKRIGQGVDTSSVMIAILSPSYLTSPECRKELEDFMAQRGPNEWLLPIYYIEFPDFDGSDDPLLDTVRSMQYEDLRELRVAGPTSPEMLRRIEQMAIRIRDLLQQAGTPASAAGLITPNAPTREIRAQVGDDGTDDPDQALLEAQAAMSSEEYGLARAILLDLLEREAHPELVFRLAVVDWYDGAFEAAIAGFESLAGTGVDPAAVLNGLGQVRIELGDFEHGIAELTTLIDADTGYVIEAYARSARALGLGGLGRFDEALGELELAERVTPGNAWLHFNRARVLEWAGEQQGAAQCFQLALLHSAPPLNRPKRIYAQYRLSQLGVFG